MTEALNVLCISTEPSASRAVVAALSELPSFAVTARTLEYQGDVVDLHDAGEPNLAIVILAADRLPGLAIIEEVHRALPGTQVLALAPDERPETIVKALRAGADEFLRLPVDTAALLKVCIKVSTVRGTATSGSHGQVWVVYGAKGGVGATTLVANLGLALRAAQRTTALVDLDVHGGDLAMFLNLTPTYTLHDIVANYRRLDPVFLQGTMMRHRSGLSLLAAPTPVPSEPPLALSGEQTLRLLELVDASHDVTVVDTTAVPTDAVRAALSCADRILLVAELTLPALRACLRTLEWLRADGVDVHETVEVVVNKYANRSWEVAPAEAAKTLRLPIRALVPRDEAAVYPAVNSGLGLDEVRGGGAVQRAIAGLVTGRATAAEEPSPVLRGFRRFFAVAERRA
jgi:pilus assembly protein CpaE